ncbi:MAG: helix-turn-helix domain-containing protein [Tannerellaceae bacterium]
MNKIIAQNLKAFRGFNRFTQEQVTDFLGLKNRSTYSNYESGEREAPLDVLEKCADLYGCDLSMFFEENEASAKEMLVCAFRIDNIAPSDMEEIASFKNIVNNYMKINSLLAK